MPATRRAHLEKSIGKRSRGLVIALTAMILSGSGLRRQQIMAQVQKNGGTSNTVKGTGTTNFIPIWTSSSTISNSILSQSGTNLNVGGNLSAVNFGGNGSGLSNVNALTLGGLSPNAFAQLGAASNVFTGAVSASSFSGNGSGVSNVNASTLGGLGPSGFAQLGVSNVFNADQTINGQLSLGGSVNNAMVLQGDQTDSSGNESANVIGGFGGDGQFPGNSVTSGVVGATIAGGGGTASGKAAQNKVTADWGTIGGGASNVASGSATVAG